MLLHSEAAAKIVAVPSPILDLQAEGKGGDVEAVPLPLLERDGQLYCSTHFHQLFADNCAGCGFGILDSMLHAMDQLWHPECFRCTECDLQLTHTSGDGEYMVCMGNAFCPQDWERLFAEEAGAAMEKGKSGHVLPGANGVIEETLEVDMDEERDCEKAALAASEKGKPQPPPLQRSPGFGRHRSAPVHKRPSKFLLFVDANGQRMDQKELLRNKRHSRGLSQEMAKSEGWDWGEMMGSMLSQAIGHTVLQHGMVRSQKSPADSSFRLPGPMDLSEEEFKATSTYVLKATTPTNPQGGGQKAHNFHILDFAPSIFHRLRELWAVSDAEYVASMCKVD